METKTKSDRNFLSLLSYIYSILCYKADNNAFIHSPRLRPELQHSHSMYNGISPV